MMMSVYASRWITLYIPQRLVQWIPQWRVRFTLAVVRRKSEWHRGCRYVLVERWLRSLRKKPTLFISGERDNYVLPSITHNMAKLAACDPENVWIVPRAKHNMARRNAPEEYDAKLSEFFAGMVAEPQTTPSAVTD